LSVLFISCCLDHLDLHSFPHDALPIYHLVGKYYVLFDRKYKEQVSELVKTGMPEEEAKAAAPLMREAQEMLKRWEDGDQEVVSLDRKSTRLNSSHVKISYAVFCLKKKK